MSEWRHVRLRSTVIAVAGSLLRIDAEGVVLDPTPAALDVMRRHPNYERIDPIAPEQAPVPPGAMDHSDLDGLDVKALKAIAASLGLPTKGSLSANTLRARIIEARGG